MLKIAGTGAIQTALYRQQRRDLRPCTRRRRHPTLPHQHWIRALRAREVRHHLEDQTVRRRQRVPHARRAGPTVRQGG